MGEKSVFWTTGATGDGTNPYTQAELFSWLRRTFSQGVHKGSENELNASVSAPNVNIATGAAICYGIPYINDATVPVNIPTPGSQERHDRIVLRADWTAQTVRIYRIAGTEGAGTPPAITENAGTIWDLKLWHVKCTTGGAITLETDEREWCQYRMQAQTANIQDGAVTTAKLATGAVTANELGTDAVETAKIKDANVTHVKLATDAVEADNIKNGEVGTNELAPDAVTAAKISAKAPGGYAWHTPGELEVDTNVASEWRPNGTITHVEAELSVKTAPTGSAIIVDINKDGTTIFTTQANRPQIAAGQTTGESVTFDVTTGSDDEEYTVDIDQIGSGTPGSDLTVTLHFKRDLVD